MAITLASVGQSAQIFRLPNADAPPVIQTRGAGRRPKGIICFRDHLFERSIAKRDADMRAKVIETMRNTLSIHEHLAHEIKHELATLLNK